MTWVVAGVVLGAALSHATWNALLRGRRGDPLAASTGLSVVWAAVGWPLVALVGPLPAEAVPALAGSVVIHVVYFGLLTAGYRTGELSLVYPIARGLPPVLVAAGSWWWLGERLSPGGWLGVLAVAAGVVGLGGLRAGSGRAVAAAVGCALCTAAYTLVDGGGARSSDAVVYLVHLVAVQGTVFAALALAWRGRPLASRVWEGRRAALGSGLLSAGGYAAALWAMTRAPVAEVAALRETSVLFAALIGATWLGEPLGRRRVLAAAVVTVGVVLVR
ncbi:MAG: EamA family transporter [Alphaproteobacteria bacterium]|nr:EamA family transporter [Alphaproteobacteria bacterium]MCB9696070.1 EamA family transporter [Alphaproteobacteria bacterium]